MSDLLTIAARRHVGRLIRAAAPFAGRMDRQFTAILRERGHDPAQIRALLAISPAAVARLGSVCKFLEQVEYNGRRLAKLNVPPAHVEEILNDFAVVCGEALGGLFAPAREQLQLATILTLRESFYQVREAEARAFFALYRAESEASSLDDLLRRFVRILTQAFQARIGRILLLDQPARGRLARALYIEQGSRDERLIVDAAMRRCRSYWSFPLRSPALLQFGFPVRYPWLPRELALVLAAGERCCEAIERVRLQEEIRRLEAEAIRAEEEERRRIGRELHDETAQAMLTLRLQLEMMERDAPTSLQPRLRSARAITERTVTGLRRLVAALGPATLERLGLEAALRQLVVRFRKLHPAQVRVSLSAVSERFSRQAGEVIYRVAQESLQNISKHSQASHVRLLLRTSDKGIRLSVADNGAGFCAETALRKPMSFGLAGMRERAALLGGSLAIRSSPGRGAAVILDLPLTSALVTPNGKNSRILD